MQDYYFSNKKFVIENYDKQKTFASFLPGVAGKMGIPIWAYYVNRGQGISSFGIRDKSSPVLEFSPASIAYQLVSTEGFRTFLKVDGKFIEPFCVANTQNAVRCMEIDESSLTIVETCKDYGYKVSIKYFGLPTENFAALVRRVFIENISDKDINIEFADGLTTIIPTGVTNGEYKDMGNLMRSWMDVYNMDENIPFYRLRASSADRAEVAAIEDGHFYFSIVDNKKVNPIVDGKLIFGYDDSLQFPFEFMNSSVKSILSSKQITANKVPCAFSLGEQTLKPKKKIQINSLFGHVENISIINKRVADFDEKFFASKDEEAYRTIRELTDDIDTKTNYEIFDEYARQSYLDNFIRGGYPALLDDGKNGVVYYLYSRKHGDLEREYNWFTISPEYYSQGNGNFRDANQNRRNDVLFKAYVKDYDVKMFMDLIQIDGYNPLAVNGVSFTIKDVNVVKSISKKVIAVEDQTFEKMISGKFTPSSIVNYLGFKTQKALVSPEEGLKIVLHEATQDFEASFGEGYWSDHWTYNFDLIENFLNVYPDEYDKFLFEDYTYKYYQSAVTVLPRSEKYVLNSKNQVRQYGAINHNDTSKAEKLGVSMFETNWLKNSNKEVYYTNLFEKLLSLATIKFSMLDSQGIGIEMEGEKPGWNDAMNGLPGLIGSGVSETLEVLRIVNFLVNSVKENREVKVLKEIDDFIGELKENLEKFYDNQISDFQYWDMTSTLREGFRVLTDLYVSGETVTVDIKNYQYVLEMMQKKLNDGIEKAIAVGNGILPSYLTYEATKYDVVKDRNGNNVLSHYGLPKVRIHEFKLKMIPYFLEAPARSYKILPKEVVANMHKKVKETDLYDKELSIYRTSTDLDPETLEMGRIRAFTKGWLERESCFLHMTYKYILGLLKAGLYEEYFNELKTNLVAFMDPKVYGRSTLENSSFIATSCNPDPATHGRGFVSRLTGANTEFLSMWNIMMFGKHVFKYVNGELKAEFKPILRKDFFDKNCQVSAKFMGTMVTYINPSMKDTYKDCKVSKISFIDGDSAVEIEGSELTGEYGLKLRNGCLRDIKIQLI